MQTALDWIRTNPDLTGWLVTLSVITFVGTLIIIPILVARIPPDYFMPDRVSRGRFVDTHPVLRLVALILKNIGGLVFLVAGIALLALPGQGLLMMLLGILLLNFPGKTRLELWLIRIPYVLEGLNKIRQKAHRSPLQIPDEESSAPE
ncbi:MAG: hypothetical protein ACI9TH_004738 [Kiritimatiellia bacterium]|jgi:hypothetical protein